MLAVRWHCGMKWWEGSFVVSTVIVCNYFFFFLRVGGAFTLDLSHVSALAFL